MSQNDEKPMIPTAVVATIGIPNVPGYKPTEAEVRLLRILLNPQYMKHNPDVRTICELAGVDSTQTYYNAIKKPGFCKVIQAYSVDPCKHRAKEYVAWLEKYAEQGSWPHLKALLAMTDIYREGIHIEVEQVRAIIKPGRAPNSKE